MAELIVKFGKINTLQSKITSTIGSLNSRINQLETRASSINGVSTGRSYLSSAVSCIYDRKEKIEEKIDSLNDFYDELECFAEDAEDADQTVANTINSTTSSFCYTQGISNVRVAGNWLSSVVDEIKTAAADSPPGRLAQAVQDWYAANKDAIWAFIDTAVNAVFTFLAVVTFLAMFAGAAAAVAAGGSFFGIFFAVILAVGAGFVAAGYFAETVTSAVSFFNYATGDSAAGDEWADRTLEDGFLWVGRSIDSRLGTDGVFETVFQFAYGALEVAALVLAVYEFAQLGKKVLKAFKADKLKWSVLISPDKSAAQKKAWIESVNWENRFLDAGNWKSAFKEITGLKVSTAAAGSSKEYQNVKSGLSAVKKLFTGVSTVDTKTVTTLMKAAAAGRTFKTVYKNVQAVFTGGVGDLAGGDGDGKLEFGVFGGLSVFSNVAGIYNRASETYRDFAAGLGY